jgi:Mce-associated membrane protein
VTDDTREVEATTETAEAVEGEPAEAKTGGDDSVTDVARKGDDSSKRANRPRDWSRMLRNVKLVPAILILLLLISSGATAWLYFERYQPNRQTDPNVARAVTRAASDGTVALLSYSPESLDKDFATAKSHLSGDFLSQYTKLIEQVVAPAAKEKSLKTTARVMGAAVSELHPDSAVVLVYVDQSTTSKDKPDPTEEASSVLVSMANVKGNWLITKFDPI